MYETKEEVFKKVKSTLQYYEAELKEFGEKFPSSKDRIEGIKRQVAFYKHIYDALQACSKSEDGVLLRIHFQSGVVLEKELTKKSAKALHNLWFSDSRSMVTLAATDGEKITLNLPDILCLSTYAKEEDLYGA